MLMRLKPGAPALKTARIKLPDGTSPGQLLQETAGRLINCRSEPLGPGHPAGKTIRRVPGLTAFATTSEQTFRGGIVVGSTAYLAFDGKVYTMDSAGVMTIIGPLSDDDRCFWARNNNATPDVVVVSPANGAFVVTGAGVSSYPDADVASPNSVCSISGYFIFGYGDGKLRASDLNSTSVNSLNFTTAEGQPDGVKNVTPLGDILYAFGDTTTELYSTTQINLEGFPFTRLTVLPIGLIGRYAVTGFEDGSALQRLFMVGNDNAAYIMAGANYQRISDPSIERLISAVSDKNAIEANVYVAEGKTVCVLKSPTWTLEYAPATAKWNERKSHQSDTWRGVNPFFAFNKWYCGDSESGNILEISEDDEEEAGQPLRMTIDSLPVDIGNAAVARVDVDLTKGIGTATGADTTETDPAIDISVSLDGGGTFSIPVVAAVGQQSEFSTQVFATRFGRSRRGRAVVRLGFSDPRDIGVMGVSIGVA